jgi:3-oxoacyl-[acyl-carrier-protein] synthase-3
MKVFIKAISYYLPSEILSNASIQGQFPEWSAEKVERKTGIKNRHLASQNETSGDMAVIVANKLFESYGIDKSSIDYLLLCTQSPDYFLPTTACIVQDKLGLSNSIGALDFNLGCSGYVYGLGLAKGLIFSGQAKNILLITAETYSKFIHSTDNSNKTIFGDAATATLVSSEFGFAEILNFEYGTDGKGSENLIVKNGGLRNYNNKVQNQNKIQISENYLYMNGPEIFLFTVSAVPDLIVKTLNKNNLSKGDIDLFILHQANKFILDKLRIVSEIDEEKFYTYFENCGNTVSSTIPIAIYHAQLDNKFKTNNHILLAGFGVGYSWGGVILKVSNNK